MFREGFSENSGLGCLGPALAGMLIFAILGWFFAPGKDVLEGAHMPVGVEFLGALMGACIGLVVGSVLGFIRDRYMTEKQRREDEF